MIDIQVGQIVFSKAGRDKKRAFVIISIEGEYIYLSDGDTRKLEKPKKKKIKHVRLTNNTDENLKNKLAGSNLLDSDIKKALKAFNSEVELQPRQAERK